MAVIDSKKLLPAGQPGSSIVKSQAPFLVPAENISFKKSAIISTNLLKPAEEKESAKKQGGKEIFEIKKKVISIKDVLKNTFFIKKKREETERKERERIKAETREKLLEKKKPEKKPEKDIPSLSIPGGSIFDSISRFIGFTLAGYLFNKYYEFLPKLIEFGKIIGPVTGYILEFGKNILNGIVDFIDFGYKTYDTIRDSIKKIGGENAQKTFDDFSKNLNIVLNGAIIAATIALSTAPKTPRGRIGKDLTGRRVRQSVQKRYLERYGKKQFIRRFGQRNLQRVAGQTTGKLAGKIAGKVFARVPIIGGLLDFAFSLAMGEKPGRAAAKAVGATIGSALGTFIPIPFAGTILGGILGDIVGGALYDTFAGNEKPTAKAEGGRVSSRQSTVAPTRRITTIRKKPIKKIQPQKTQPGRDIGGKQKIEQLYGVDEPGQRSALRALKDSSNDVKRMKALGGLPGAMFGAGIDLALGQKPDRNLSRDLGNIFGSVIQSAVDAEVNASFLDITNSLGMANGGIVPSRGIRSDMSLGEKVGRRIATVLEMSIQGAAASVLNNLNRELRLEGGAGPDGSTGGDPGGPDGPGGVGGGNVSVSSDSPDFWILAVGALLENSHPQGAADVAQVIYNRATSAAWPSTIRQVILQGNGGQFQPVRDYGTISAWQAINNKDSAVNFIKKYGKGRTQAQLESVAAALLDTTMQGSSRTFIGPRDSFRAIAYEVANNHLADDTEVKRHGHVFGFEPLGAQIAEFRAGKLSAAQISQETRGTVTQLTPQPSKVTSAAFKAVLPEGNPQFTSGFGPRSVSWGSKDHKGIDIGVDRGSKVLALSDGTVSIIPSFMHGSAVVITHSDGSKTLYGHVDPTVKNGDKVKKGQVIAKVKFWPKGVAGATYPDNTHLHLERHVGGTPIDPSGFLNSLKPNPKPKPVTRPPSPATTTSVSKSTPKGESYLVNGKMYFVDFKNNIIKDANGNIIDVSKGKNKWLLKAISEQRNSPYKPKLTPTLSGQLQSSLQHHPSYSQGGMATLHDVNNIVMPILVG